MQLNEYELHAAGAQAMLREQRVTWSELPRSRNAAPVASDASGASLPEVVR